MPLVSSFLICVVDLNSIVNGSCDKRFDDGLTFISQTGGSAVDYFNVSNELFVDTFLSSFEIVPRVESSHLPIVLCAGAIRADTGHSGQHWIFL